MIVGQATLHFIGGPLKVFPVGIHDLQTLNGFRQSKL